MKSPRLRAPHEDGALLISPDWKELPALVEENRTLLEQSPMRVGNRPLGELRQGAREAVQKSLAAWYGELGWKCCMLQSPLIMTGHQPELFHPGVWAKNVAVSSLARKLSGSSLNINVDSDVAKSTALRLPLLHGKSDLGHFAFCETTAPIPYEEWRCEDESRFARFPQEVEHVTREWPWTPVLPEFWRMAAQTRAATIPERWVIARHLWEEQLGVSNHELTMSRWCETEFFQWLTRQFVAEGERFANVYNEELKAYRKKHRIRSANHPVADLVVTSERVELPFWAWRSGTTQRGRLFKTTEKNAQLVALTGGKELLIPPGSNDWKIRPKALITSMMFRLFLADLFVHGIGGAVYDELTDRIFQRFWNLKLPRFAVVTATLRLPWGRIATTENSPRLLRYTLRRIHWNPDEFLKDTEIGTVRALAQQKQKLVMDSPEHLARRHEQLDSVREQLWPFVQNKERGTEQELRETLVQLKRDEHHFSRELSWVLYPREKLEGLIRALLRLDG